MTADDRFDLQRSRYEGPTGTIVPKASVNAIRSGYPFNLTSAPQVASFYVDTRILPGANPLDVRDELRGLLARVGVEGTVELFLYRPGFEAVGAERLIEGTLFGCNPVAPDHLAQQVGVTRLLEALEGDRLAHQGVGDRFRVRIDD